MRILFVTYGPRPHFFPMAPLAWACRLAGHEVRVAGAPALTSPLGESGLLGVSVGADADVSGFLSSGAFRPKAPQPGESAEDALENFIDGIVPIAFLRCAAMVDDLIAFARLWRPDLIIYDPVTFAGPVAAQVLGIPAACNLYGMARQFRVEMEKLNGSGPRQEYIELFEKQGAEPLIDPVAWIDPCPPSLRWQRTESTVITNAPRLGMRYVTYNGPFMIPQWLIEPPSRPRVVITWGTTQEKKLGAEVLEKARLILDSISDLDAELVVTVGATSPDHLRYLQGLPGNVRLVEWTPFHVVAETCAAVIHTGGTGILLTSAACGLPQLGITALPEGQFNTEQLAAAGAGVHIPQAEADAEAIRSAVTALLYEPQYGKKAEILRQEIDRQPAPGDVVHALEQLV